MADRSLLCYVLLLSYQNTSFHQRLGKMCNHGDYLGDHSLPLWDKFGAPIISSA